MADSNWSPSPFRHLPVREFINGRFVDEGELEADLIKLQEETK